MNDAWLGLTGVVIGSLIAIVGNVVMLAVQDRRDKMREEPRRKLLREMLDHPKYKMRQLDTLMHVIDADEETTKRLLIEVGARASEDGQPLWGLLKRNPLPTDKQ